MYMKFSTKNKVDAWGTILYQIAQPESFYERIKLDIKLIGP